MTCPIFEADTEGIQRAAGIILDGGVVAFPTETFYGLGADALNEGGVQKIFEAKGRKEDKPLLLLIADPSWVAGLVQEIPPHAQRLMERFWPGALTLVFAAAPHLPPAVTAHTGKVGVRLSSHPVAQALARAAGRAVTGTSANLSGRPGAVLPGEVLETLGAKIDALLDGGRTAGGPGSTVVDVSEAHPRIIRPGAIPEDDLAPFLIPALNRT